jgi:hypothetical protein
LTVRLNASLRSPTPPPRTFKQQRGSDDKRNHRQNRATVRSPKAEDGTDGHSAAAEPFPDDEVI